MIAQLIGTSGIPALDFVCEFILIVLLLLMLFGFFRALIIPKKGGLK